MSSPPLENWPALRTFSVDEAEHALRSIYGANNFAVRKTDKPFSAHANYKALNAISFSYCSYSSPVTIRFPEAPFYRQAFSVGGTGRILIGRQETPILKQHAHVVPVDVPLPQGQGKRQLRQCFRARNPQSCRSVSPTLLGLPSFKRLD